MKIVAALVAVLALAAPSQAYYLGVLDLAKDPEAVVVRDAQEGMWLGGAQKQLWHLERRECNVAACAFVEIFHVGFATVYRLEGNQAAYGPAIGLPIGAALSVLASKIQLISAASDVAPPFLKKLGDWVSVDAYALYRPQLSEDAQHHFLYGVGGKIRIPISDVLSWAKGSGSQKGL